MMRTLSLPCLSSSLHTHAHTTTCYFGFSSPPRSSSSSSSSFISAPHSHSHRRFHFLTPCSSLKQTKKQQQLRKISTAPSGIRRLFSPNSDGDGDKNNEADSVDLDGGSSSASALTGTLLAGVLLVGVVGGFASVGYIYKDQINSFLNQFSVFIEGCFYPFHHFSFCLNYPSTSANPASCTTAPLKLLLRLTELFAVRDNDGGRAVAAMVLKGRWRKHR